MIISASEFILLCSPPAENVKRLSQIVPEVELMVDGDAWDYGENGWEPQAETLASLNVPFTIHPPAWDVNPASPISALREAAAFLNKESIKLCQRLNAKEMVFHPGYYDDTSLFSKNRARDYSYKLLEELIALAKPAGITLGFENIAGPSSTLFTQDEFVNALNGVDPCVKYLLDLGHANINGWDIPKVIEQLGDRLCCFHIHDNDGTGDTHQPIGYGTIPWANVFSAMRGLTGEYICVLEYQAGTPLEQLTVGVETLQKALS